MEVIGTCGREGKGQHWFEGVGSLREKGGRDPILAKGLASSTQHRRRGVADVFPPSLTPSLELSAGHRSRVFHLACLSPRAAQSPPSPANPDPSSSP